MTIHVANGSIGSSGTFSGRVMFGTTSVEERPVPTFTRYSGNPLFSASTQGQPAPTIYWPYVLNVGSIAGLTPLDQWYMYYTTDHASTGVVGSGGVYLATAPAPEGPWSFHGQVFVDSGGSQTENASIVWDEDTNAFKMFYKVFPTSGSLGDMVVALATSPDGLTWTKVGTIIDQPFLGAHPNGNAPQSGYIRPFRVGKHWHAHLMIGGGNQPLWGHAQSHDGVKWIVDGRPMGFGCDTLTDTPLDVATVQGQNALRFEMNTGDVIWWCGRYWWVGIISNFVSGATPKTARLGCVPINADLRTPDGPPYWLLQPPTGTNESYNYRTCFSRVVAGRVYLYYQCDGNMNLAVSQ